MTGKRIGDHQVKIYKRHRAQLSQEAAAAKSGISVRSARRLEKANALPSQRQERAWRTRNDPFESVWESELVPMLAETPGLTAITLLEELQRRYPGTYDNALLRTLQRRVRLWKACNGAEREVYFAQTHPPGRLGLSDFTHAAVLQVTIAGVAFVHMLYQFALAYSGWRYVEVVLGGESYAALSSGMQNAFWMMGGVPEEHRTDSLSAAYKNHVEHEVLTRRYEGLCKHYEIRPSRNNLGVSHENGSIEARQKSLKNTMEQALLLRGYRDFADVDSYQRFVAEVFTQMNGRVGAKFKLERDMLKALPARRNSDYEELDVRVTKYSTMTVKRVLYTVPSRLVGHTLKVRLYSDRLEAWLGGVCTLELMRGKAGTDNQRGRMVDYRHLLPTLKRKPGALARSVLLDDLFPRSEYRQMWAQLRDQLSEGQACRLMVELLDLAGNDGCEAALASRLAMLLAANELPDIEQLRKDLSPRQMEQPQVSVILPSLASYDELIVEAA